MLGLIPFLFLLSGVSGLIYEVLWAKQLVLVLGDTALAHTMVLAVFMAGLAWGNAALGSRSDQARDPVRFYGLLELAIAACGALSLPLMGALSDAYIALARSGAPASVCFAAKLMLCVLVILAPAALMGGTLPALSRFAVRRMGRTESAVSSLYACNSAGASLGALLAGFWLVPAYGLTLPVYAAAGLNLLIGLGALLLSWKAGSRPDLAVAPELPARKDFAPDPRGLDILLSAVFVSGFAALCYEIAWIRLLAVVLGSSAYAFSLMLSAFIAGLALGSLLVRRVLLRLDACILFGLAEAGIGLSVLLTLPLYNRLPYLHYLASGMLQRTPAAFHLHQVFQAGICFLLMLLPTMCMGATLPLAAAAAARGSERIGGQVGKVFGLNALGNVLGALAAGLFLLPWLGIERLILACVALNALAAGAVLAVSPSRAWRLAAAAGGVCSALFLTRFFLSPGLNLLVLSSGEFRPRPAYEQLSYRQYLDKFKEQSLLYYKDDSDATITVFGEPGDVVLKTNGKSDASAASDLATEILCAQLPLILKPGVRDMLMVGLGSGISAGAALSHPIARLDLVELSRAVVEANRFFASYNGSPLEDARLSLHVDDAKSFLRLTTRRYDVIMSEPPNPWVAGVGNLFSADFYRQAAAHLRPGGLMVQWFHLYEMDDETLRLILRTFSSQFGHVLVWEIPPSRGDILLLGSAEPLNPDFALSASESARPEVARDLARIDVSRLSTVLSLQLASDQVARSLAGPGRVNEDQFPVLEYAAPKALFLHSVSGLLSSKDERLRARAPDPLFLTRYLKARGRPLSGDEFRELAAFQERFNGDMLRPFLEEWARRYPEDVRPLWSLVQLDLAAEDAAGALAGLEDLLRLRPRDPDYLDLAADLALRSFLARKTFLSDSPPDAVLGYLRRLAAATRGARRTDALRRLAEVHANIGSLAEAMRFIAEAAASAAQAKGGPSPDFLWVMGARMALDRGDPGRARACAEQALRLNPANPAAKGLLRGLPASGR